MVVKANGFKADELLLVVEDSDEDFFTLKRILQRLAVPNPIHRCSDGDEALDFVYRRMASDPVNPAACPRVILLDLNLPGTDGRDVLAQLKQDASYKQIPIVVYTTSSNPHDVERCYQQGANGYLVKPLGMEELKDTLQAFVRYWLENNISPGGLD
jgi:CheY-like chemotaxis protein